MDNLEPEKLTSYAEMLQEHEKKELRIIKQAIAKSFIAAGKFNLNDETERQIEEWIRWVYRDEQKDWRMVRERENPF